MIVIVLENSIAVIGPFDSTELAQSYLSKEGYERLSDCYWAGTHKSHALRAHITTMEKP